MVGPPVKGIAAVGQPRRPEQQPEGLLKALRAIAMADEGGKNLPLRGTWSGSRVAHRDTS
jgi:hypothetical protein